MKNLHRTNDLTGKKFGRLTVIGLDDRGTRRTYWVCQCECGNIKVARSDALVSGRTKSCGCIKKEQDKINLSQLRHNQAGTRLYTIWQKMKDRCFNEHNPAYYRYGGRGIQVCDSWKERFENFYDWAMNNGYQENLTLDRTDNDGNYCPENCRWVTMKEQCNNRSSNIQIKIGNATKSLTEWCKIFQVDYKATLGRYNRNGCDSIDDLFNSKG